MKCPTCGGECERDEVDNGVGMEGCGPWGCPDCHRVEERWTLDAVDPVPGVVAPRARATEDLDRSSSLICPAGSRLDG